MAKTYLSTVKYVIKTNFTIEGIVDKHDIIGAIFGQSEGLIGEEMDLKELQKNGKLGRIEVETEVKSGKTVGILTIPSSLDRVQTSILAAAIESVDKVGPCNSEFVTTSIEDARKEKRKTVTERAKELLLKMGTDMPETQELAEEIRGLARTSDLKEIGRDKIPIGPEVDSSRELILVEGRADVINLVKHGIKNVAGIGGAKISRTIINLVKGKNVTIFVDGDRGGDIIARQMCQAMKIEFIAKAPDGKEVEELTLKEILSALRKKEESEKVQNEKRIPYRTTRAPVGRSTEREPGTRSPGRRSYGIRESAPRERSYESRSRASGSRSYGTDSPRSRSYGTDSPRSRSYGERTGRSPRPRSGSYERPKPRSNFDRPNARPVELPVIQPKDIGIYTKPMQELEGSLKARFFDTKMKKLKEVNVRELLKEIGKTKSTEAIVFDGIVTKRLLEAAEKSKIKQLVGVKKGRIEDSETVKVSTLY